MEGKVIISREEYESSLRDFIEKEKLQKRIDKAIEYINKYLIDTELPRNYKYKLRDILKGE